MNNKKIVVSVISDLVSDQRVNKICLFLHQKGAEVVLIGRSFQNSLPVSERPYQTERILCRYRKGPLQYIEFMYKLYRRLFKLQAEILVSNDLDTLLPNYLHSKHKKAILVYDSHEYFTGAPELRDRKLKRYTWKLLERILLPRVKYSYTVNESVQLQYKKEYGIDMKVVRNMPFLNKPAAVSEIPQLPKNRKVLIMQGAGINPERGFEEAILAMQFLNEEFLLVIAGSGTILEKLQNLTNSKHLQQKVLFLPKMPFETLHYVTKQASLGLSLDKPDSMNYIFSLPNKVFDYIHAGVPVLASSVFEVKKIIEGYKTGICIDKITPENIANAIHEIFERPGLYEDFKNNTLVAREELNWENEMKVLEDVYNFS